MGLKSELQLPTPEIRARADRQRLAETVVIPTAPEIRAYIAELGDRAEQVRSRAVSPEEDNMLKISTDGRKAALDMRFATGQPTQDACKLQIAARRIAQIWEQNREQSYIDRGTAQRSLTLGALQIVFCDLGTPTTAADWNAYDELRDQLATHGVPRERVRFIHEARNDAEKGRLFAAARAGHIAVLIGTLRDTITAGQARQQAHDKEIDALTTAISRRTDTRRNKFAMTINATTTRERKHAGQLLAQWASEATPGKAAPVGELGSLEVLGVVRRDYTNGSKEAVLQLAGLPSEPAHATFQHLHENPLSLIRQLEHRLGDLDALKARTEIERQDAISETLRARDALATPFKHADSLTTAPNAYAKSRRR